VEDSGERFFRRLGGWAFRVLPLSFQVFAHFGLIGPVALMKDLMEVCAAASVAARGTGQGSNSRTNYGWGRR
jgi:hypothetical protein